MLKKQILILYLLFIGVMLNAQESKFSMNDAVEYAYQNQIQIRLAQNSIADAKEEIKEIRATGLPQINGAIDYNHFIQIPQQVVPANLFGDPTLPDDLLVGLPFGTKNTFDASATLSTLIFDGTFLVGLQAARSSVSYQNANYNNVKQDIRSNVKKAYLPPLLIKDNILTVEKNLTSLTKMHKEMSEMFNAGFIEQLDVDRLALSIDNLETTLSDLETNYTLTLNALKFQMGFPLNEALVLIDKIDIKELNESTLITQELDYQDRADYAIFEELKTLNELNIKRYKAGYLPSLSGFILYKESIAGENIINSGYSSSSSIAGLKLNVPIFDSFSKRAKIQRAKLGLEAVKMQQELAKSGIDLNVSMAKKNFINSKVKIADRQKNVDLAQRIYDMTQVKYKEGVGSSIEMIQAEQSLFQSQQNYSNALYDYMTALIDLELALGIK